MPVLVDTDVSFVAAISASSISTFTIAIPGFHKNIVMPHRTNKVQFLHREIFGNPRRTWMTSKRKERRLKLCSQTCIVHYEKPTGFKLPDAVAIVGSDYFVVVAAIDINQIPVPFTDMLNGDRKSTRL